jgi:hypothetical protein
MCWFSIEYGSQARVNFGGAIQPRLGRKEPNMLIIDSLLKFNCFLSGEVQENLSLFWGQARAAMAWPASSTAQHSFDPSYG